MPRKSRIDAAGAIQHVIARGINRSAIFSDDEFSRRPSPAAPDRAGEAGRSLPWKHKRFSSKIRLKLRIDIYLPIVYTS